MKNIKFYEIIFGSHVEDNANRERGLDTELAENHQGSICILGVKKPTREQAEQFCSEDMREFGWDYVFSVAEITEEEAKNAYDLDNIEDWPVFPGKPL